MGFKLDFDKKERICESTKIIIKYPTRIPIIVEKYTNCKLNDINKKKYLVPKDMTMGQFTYIIRKRISLDSTEAIFITINGSLSSSSEIVGSVYESKKDKDGFLYLTYTSENTFG